MLEEFLKAAREQVADRLASPLLGSFLVSWCLWNYRFLVILFSDATVSQTFRMIETIAFPDATQIVLRGVLLPSITAALYIFVYPYPAKFVYGFTRRRQKDILDLRRMIEDETPLTIEDSRQLRGEMMHAEQKHRDELDRMARDLARAREELEKLRPQPLTPPPKLVEPPEIPPRLEPSQRELMRKLERAGGKATHDALVTQSGHPKVRTEFDLGELQRFELLSKKFDQDERDYTYEFTQKGRRIVLESANNHVGAGTQEKK